MGDEITNFNGLIKTVSRGVKKTCCYYWHYCSLQVGSVSNFEIFKIQFFIYTFLEIFNSW